MSESKSSEKVLHPAYYNWIPGVECLDVIEHFDFNPGCAIKYIWRAPRKPSEEAIIDYRKAIFYLKREIVRCEGMLVSKEGVPDLL